MTSGPQHVIRAIDSMEWHMTDLLQEAVRYSKSIGGDGSDITFRRRELLKTARRYTSAVNKLTMVRKR